MAHENIEEAIAKEPWRDVRPAAREDFYGWWETQLRSKLEAGTREYGESYTGDLPLLHLLGELLDSAFYLYTELRRQGIINPNDENGAAAFFQEVWE